MQSINTFNLMAKHVALVGFSPVEYGVMRYALSQKRFRVSKSVLHAELQAYLEQDRVDLLLITGDRSTLATLQPLWEHNAAPRVPVLALLEREQSEMISELRQYGVSICLRKPVSWNELHYWCSTLTSLDGGVQKGADDVRTDQGVGR